MKHVERSRVGWSYNPYFALHAPYFELGGKTFAAFEAAAFKDVLPHTAGHAFHKSMYPRAAAFFGLVGLL